MLGIIHQGHTFHWSQPKNKLEKTEATFFFLKACWTFKNISA